MPSNLVLGLGVGCALLLLLCMFGWLWKACVARRRRRIASKLGPALGGASGGGGGKQTIRGGSADLKVAQLVGGGLKEKVSNTIIYRNCYYFIILLIY